MKRVALFNLGILRAGRRFNYGTDMLDNATRVARTRIRAYRERIYISTHHLQSASLKVIRNNVPNYERQEVSRSLQFRAQQDEGAIPEFLHWLERPRRDGENVEHPFDWYDEQNPAEEGHEVADDETTNNNLRRFFKAANQDSCTTSSSGGEQDAGVSSQEMPNMDVDDGPLIAATDSDASMGTASDEMNTARDQPASSRMDLQQPALPAPETFLPLTNGAAGNVGTMSGTLVPMVEPVPGSGIHLLTSATGGYIDTQAALAPLPSSSGDETESQTNNPQRGAGAGKGATGRPRGSGKNGLNGGAAGKQQEGASPKTQARQYAEHFAQTLTKGVAKNVERWMGKTEVAKGVAAAAQNASVAANDAASSAQFVAAAARDEARPATSAARSTAQAVDSALHEISGQAARSEQMSASAMKDVESAKAAAAGATAGIGELRKTADAIISDAGTQFAEARKRELGREAERKQLLATVAQLQRSLKCSREETKKAKEVATTAIPVETRTPAPVRVASKSREVKPAKAKDRERGRSTSKTKVSSSAVPESKRIRKSERRAGSSATDESARGVQKTNRKSSSRKASKKNISRESEWGRRGRRDSADDEWKARDWAYHWNGWSSDGDWDWTQARDWGNRENDYWWWSKSKNEDWNRRSSPAPAQNKGKGQPSYLEYAGQKGWAELPSSSNDKADHHYTGQAPGGDGWHNPHRETDAKARGAVEQVRTLRELAEASRFVSINKNDAEEDYDRSAVRRFVTKDGVLETRPMESSAEATQELTADSGNGDGYGGGAPGGSDNDRNTESGSGNSGQQNTGTGGSGGGPPGGGDKGSPPASSGGKNKKQKKKKKKKKKHDKNKKRRRGRRGHRLRGQKTLSLEKKFSEQRSLLTWKAYLETKVSAAVKPSGALISEAQERDIVKSDILEKGHTEEQRRAIYALRFIRDNHPETWLFRNYWMSLLQLRGEMASEFTEFLRAWSISHGGWRNPRANLHAELLRFKDAAYGIGFSLKGKTPERRLLILHEVGGRILLGPEMLARVIEELKEEFPSFSQLLKCAEIRKNAKTAMVMINHRDPRLAKVNNMATGGSRPLVQATSFYKFSDAVQPRRGKQICFRCGREGHTASECSEPRPVCWICKKPGHMKAECPTLKKESGEVRAHFSNFIRNIRQGTTAKRPTFQRSGSRGGKGRGKTGKGRNYRAAITFTDAKTGIIVDAIGCDVDASAIDGMGETPSSSPTISSVITEQTEDEFAREPVVSFGQAIAQAVRAAVQKVKVCFSKPADAVGLFLADSGFSKDLHFGRRKLEKRRAFCKKFGLSLEFLRVRFSAQTAGGSASVLGLAQVLHRLPVGCPEERRAGIANAIVIDDRGWEQEAVGLLGVVFLERAKMDVINSEQVMRCGKLLIPPNDEKQYLVDIWKDLTPGFVRRVARRGVSNCADFPSTERTESNFGTWGAGESEVEADATAGYVRDQSNEKITAADLADVSEYRSDQIWHACGRIFCGVTNAPGLLGVDSRAQFRSVRDLDEVRARLHAKNRMDISSVHLIEEQLAQDGEKRPNLLCVYYFDQPQDQAEAILDMTGMGLPIISNRKHEVTAKRFQRATETPTNLASRRVISIDHGRQLPLLIRGRGKGFKVPPELESYARDEETGLSARAQEEIKEGLAFLGLQAEAVAFLGRWKTGRAVITGDGKRGAVAVAELVGDHLKLRGDKKPAHLSLRSLLAANGERPTSTGKFVRYGFGRVSPARDFFDSKNPTALYDPRRSMTVRQQHIYAHLKAYATRQNFKVTEPFLRKVVKTKLRGAAEGDVAAAVETMARAVVVGTVVQLVRKISGDVWDLRQLPGGRLKSKAILPLLEAEAAGTVAKMRAKMKTKVATSVMKKQTTSSPSKDPPPPDDGGGDPFEPFGETDDAKGQPTSAAIVKFVSENLDNVGRVLLVDPGRESVSVELVRLCIGAGIKVKAISKNTPRAMAVVESAHLQPRAELEAAARHPLLRELGLSLLIPLCLSARRERNELTAFLEKGEEWRPRSRGQPVEADCLRWFDMEAARESKVERIEHREAARAVVSQALLDSKLHDGARAVYEHIAEQERGFVPRSGELLEWQEKSPTIWKAGHYLGPVAGNNKLWQLRPLGAVNTAADVHKDHARRVPESAALFQLPDSVEIQYNDAQELESVLEQVKAKGYFDRVLPSGRGGVIGATRLLPCVECGEFRFVEKGLKGSVVRCAALAPQTFCGDVSGDVLASEGMWIPEKRPRDDANVSGWRHSDALVAGEDVSSQERAAQLSDAVEQIEFEPDGLELEHESDSDEEGVRLENEDDANVEGADEEAEEEVVGDGMAEANADAENEDDLLAASVGVNCVDISVDDFNNMLDGFCAQVHSATIPGVNDLKKEVKVEDPAAITWDASKSDVLGFGCNRGSGALFVVVERLREMKARGAHVESAEFETFANFLSRDPVREGWAAPRDLLDEISLVWGSGAAAKLDGGNSLSKGRTCLKFFIVPCVGLGRRNECCFVKEPQENAIGAIRYEFAERFSTSPGNPEKMAVSQHAPGMAAASRKRLRAARKLADWLPSHVLDNLEFDEYVSHALAKEFGGTLIPVAEGEEANVVPLGDEAVGDREVLPSRFILDAKWMDELSIIIKSRWAPGGHKQEQPAEQSENSSPTVSPVQLRAMLQLAGLSFARVIAKIFDVPRAFNCSDPYESGGEPLMAFPRVSGRLRKAFERGLNILNSRNKTSLRPGQTLKLRVPQCGLLDAAYAWYAKARKSLLEHKTVPAVLSPAVCRLLDKNGSAIAFMSSHVGDFLLVADGSADGLGECLERRMLSAFRSLAQSCFIDVKEEWTPYAGKSVRLVTTPSGAQAFDISLHEKAREGRPLKVTGGNTKPDRGAAEFFAPEDAELAPAKEEQLRPLTAHVLLAADKDELFKAIDEQKPARTSMLGWGVRTHDTPVGSSFGAEAVGYDFGTQATEVVKLTMADMREINPKGEVEDELVRRAARAEECDFLDSSPVIARLLNRQPTAEPEVAVFRGIARARGLLQSQGKQLAHISDVSNLCDVATKRFPACNAKREKMRWLMTGERDWISCGGDKRGNGIGVLRGLSKKEARLQDVEQKDVEQWDVAPRQDEKACDENAFPELCKLLTKAKYSADIFASVFGGAKVLGGSKKDTNQKLEMCESNAVVGLLLSDAADFTLTFEADSGRDVEKVTVEKKTPTFVNFCRPIRIERSSPDKANAMAKLVNKGSDYWEKTKKQWQAQADQHHKMIDDIDSDKKKAKLASAEKKLEELDELDEEARKKAVEKLEQQRKEKLEAEREKNLEKKKKQEAMAAKKKAEEPWRNVAIMMKPRGDAEKEKDAKAQKVETTLQREMDALEELRAEKRDLDRQLEFGQASELVKDINALERRVKSAEKLAKKAWKKQEKAGAAPAATGSGGDDDKDKEDKKPASKVEQNEKDSKKSESSEAPATKERKTAAEPSKKSSSSSGPEDKKAKENKKAADTKKNENKKDGSAQPGSGILEKAKTDLEKAKEKKKKALEKEDYKKAKSLKLEIEKLEKKIEELELSGGKKDEL
eukprot:g18079.t1